MHTDEDEAIEWLMQSAEFFLSKNIRIMSYFLVNDLAQNLNQIILSNQNLL